MRHVHGYPVGGLLVAVFVLAGFAVPSPGLAAGQVKLERELVIATGGGAYEKALREHFFDPFTAETGVKVISVSAGTSERWAKIKAMAQVGNVEWDLTISIESPIIANRKLLAEIDCEKIPNAKIHGLPGACVEHGLLLTAGGNPMAYSTEAFPQTRRPKSWADFWDVERFPGPRALPNYGEPVEVLMMALSADGVPSDRLFPLDLDRAFRKLDEIKPHVKVWWKSGDQSQQIMRSREVVLSWMWSGRALSLKAAGFPIEVEWNQAITDDSYWVLIKNAPHPNAAMAFLDFFMGRPEAHLAFGRQINYETSSLSALSLVPEAERASRAMAHRHEMLKPDHRWVAENRDRILERWNKWLAE